MRVAGWLGVVGVHVGGWVGGLTVPHLGLPPQPLLACPTHAPSSCLPASRVSARHLPQFLICVADMRVCVPPVHPPARPPPLLSHPLCAQRRVPEHAW